MRRLHWWLVVALAVGVMAPGGAGLRAQDTPIDRKAVNTHVYGTLREVINQGADLYNASDWNGCYRMYQGALISLRPFLDHRPELQKAIDDGLAKAKDNTDTSRRAFDLRTVIDRIRAETNPGMKGGTPVPAAKLWDRLGGQAVVTKVVEDFMVAVAMDNDIDFTRKGKFPIDGAHLKKRLIEFISSATEGPHKYEGKSMKEAHKGMAITEAQFNASAKALENALKKNGAKPEDIAAVLKAVGGTKDEIVEKSKPAPPKDEKAIKDAQAKVDTAEADLTKARDDLKKAEDAEKEAKTDTEKTDAKKKVADATKKVSDAQKVLADAKDDLKKAKGE
jgi:hemoglobin